ncbi:DNA-binding transcriptional regulator, AcrR family [Actinoplanes philippinensis]|uniref:DNA-binding transcriptional regulator, AcrR family n=1 Tax=Actinoplanes philippinensis TaxID=35752 RepID=A0A1I2M8E1_9ACTN|nr:DNA-binding transcriptional regulator, AcrR family [Actinoplanes philippinensis]
MTTVAPSAYHRRVAGEKRAAILSAATGLFLSAGYDGTSLARIAEAAGVSKATLFKQFPTKAALFDAIVTESWQVEEDAGPEPPAGDLRAGLTMIGHRYADLLTRPGMTALFRIVIAELPRFPELGEAQFSRGKMPYFTSVSRYLAAAHAAGSARVHDADLAATQFLGMIANFVFWPTLLLTDWAPARPAVDQAVEEAVATMVARYQAVVPASAG